MGRPKKLKGKPVGTPPEKPGPKFGSQDSAEREEVLNRVAELQLLGFSQREIAEQLGVSQPAVVGYLKEIRQRWLDHLLEDRKLFAGQSIHRYQILIREAWKEYHRLVNQPAITRTHEEVQGGEGGGFIRDAEVISANRGALDCLRLIKEIQDSLNRLLGLNEAIKIALSGKMGVGFSFDSLFGEIPLEERTSQTIENLIQEKEREAAQLKGGEYIPKEEISPPKIRIKIKPKV